MNKYDFTALVKDPSGLGENDVDKLKALVNEYPYFPIGQNLLVKALFNSKHYEYDKSLKQAALQAGNRSVLYNLVHDLPLETESMELVRESVESLHVESINPREFQSVSEPVETSDNSGPVSEPANITGPETVIPEVHVELPPVVQEIRLPEPDPAPEAILPEPEIEREQFIEENSNLDLIDQKEEERIIVIRDPNQISEDEKLIRPTGNFVKFIPKPKSDKTQDETSLIGNIGDPEDEVLGDFDISSLDSPGYWKSSYQETPPVVGETEMQLVIKNEPLEEVDNIERTPEEFENQEVVSPTSGVEIPGEELVDNSEPNKIQENYPETEEVVEETKIDSEATVQADPEFLNWLSHHSTTEDESGISNEIEVREVVEPELAIPEDAEISERLQIIESVEEFEEPESTSSNYLEVEVSVPEFEDSFAMAFSPVKPEGKKSEVSETDYLRNSMLQSLDEHEVDLFKAPLYRQLQLNDSLFENDFNKVYPSSTGNKAVKKTDSEQIEFSSKATEISIPVFEFEMPELKNQQKVPVPEIVIPQKTIVEHAKVEPVKKEEEIKPKITETPQPRIKRDNQNVESILDKFIRENPSIARPKSEFYSPVNMARQSVEESNEIVSETLASIYLKQGLHKKAIAMYEKLGLLYPDKFPYFADLIQKVKTENNLD